MGSAERVIDALNLRIPDKVPYMYGQIDHSIREKILGQKIVYDYPKPKAEFASIGVPGKPSFIEPIETTDARVARKLGLDAVGMSYFPPFFAEICEEEDGSVYVKNGLLTSPEMLEKMQLPDLDDDRLYKPAVEFVKKYKGEFALYSKIRLGISFILNSMGIEAFSYNILDYPDAVKEAISKYTGWVSRLCKNLIEIGFDFLWSFDDMAFKTTLMFSLDVWDEFFFPYLKKAADSITIPWVFHSDGNLMPILDRLLKLGMSGLHPLEPGTMDLDVLKRDYGKKVCLIGNIDIDYVLSQGTEEEVEQQVKERIAQMGPGGGFIISDSNSIPGYCKPENIIAMSNAVKKYREIYAK